MTIRAAVAADAPRLAALRFDFRAGIAAPAEPRDAFLERCGRWMADQLASGSWRAWVAERNGEIVGQVWMNLIDKVPNPVGERARHAYISNLFVIEQARGGIGTALLEAALAWARDQRVDRVVLWPSAASRSLYLRYGFTPAGDVLEKTL